MVKQSATVEPAVPAEVVPDDAPSVPAVVTDAPQYLPPDELPTPRMKLLQKPSETHRDGIFVNNLTDEEIEKLDCIVLGMRRGRILWGELGNDEPLCRSRDFVHGEGDPGGACDACPLKDWVDDEKPKCAATIDFAALDDQGVPFFLQVSRTGIKPAHAFIASAQYRGKPLYYSAVTISLRRVTKPAPHYVPVFKRGKDVDVAVWPEFEGVLKRLSAAWDRAQVEAPKKEDVASSDY